MDFAITRIVRDDRASNRFSIPYRPSAATLVGGSLGFRRKFDLLLQCPSDRLLQFEINGQPNILAWRGFLC